MTDEQIELVEVTRSELRQNQRSLLKMAHGRHVLIVTGPPDEQKIILDRRTWTALLEKMESLQETLAITMDRKLFNQILSGAATLEDELRVGALYSLEDAFASDDAGK